MNMTGSSSRIAAVRRPFASAGVAGITTFRPATCVNHASRDFECCAALPRPEPPWVRTTSGTRACPPNMKRFCAAWFDDLVDRQTGEVDVHQLDDRPQAGERGADARADDPELADRRLADALGPELGEQAGGHLERAAVLGDVLAHDQDPRVALHLEPQRVAERLGVEHARSSRRSPGEWPSQELA